MLILIILMVYLISCLPHSSVAVNCELRLRQKMLLGLLMQLELFKTDPPGNHNAFNDPQISGIKYISQLNSS